MKGFQSGFSYLHTLTQKCGMCGANTTDDQLVQALRGLIKFAGKAYAISLKEGEGESVRSSDQEPEGDAS